MLLAVRRLLALEAEVWSLRAGVVQTLLAPDVHHTVLSMLFAVQRRPAANDIELWLLRAGLVQTSLAADVHHALHGMLLAVRPRLALEIEVP